MTWIVLRGSLAGLLVLLVLKPGRYLSITCGVSMRSLGCMRTPHPKSPGCLDSVAASLSLHITLIQILDRTCHVGGGQSEADVICRTMVRCVSEVQLGRGAEHGKGVLIRQWVIRWLNGQVSVYERGEAHVATPTTS